MTKDSEHAELAYYGYKAVSTSCSLRYVSLVYGR